MSAYSDPFHEARQSSGVMQCPFHGEDITMILRHEDVRKAAKDWQTFSSDAPFRVPVPSEEDVRSMRQLPIETNPPEHTEYREIVEPFFQRAKDPQMIARVEALMGEMLEKVLSSGETEMVNHFALPVQSRALTYLLNTDEQEAETWIGWGIHVFKVTGGEFKKGNVLEDYLQWRFDQAEAKPGEGRDTIIHTITCALGYLAEHPEALEWLRADQKRITLASEEFFRVFMPLTHIGRVCPERTELHGTTVAPGARVSLCWSSANFDEAAFPAPMEIRMDRKPNPHLSFGFGTHLCLGAPHARLILRTLLKQLCVQVKSIRIIHAEERVEHEATFERKLGYDSLVLAFERL
jgi:cytochrome P450